MFQKCYTYPKVVIKKMLFISEQISEGKKSNSSLINYVFIFRPTCSLLVFILWCVPYYGAIRHSTCLAGGYVVYQSQLFLSLCCDAMLLCMHYVLMLFACACDDRTTA